MAYKTTKSITSMHKDDHWDTDLHDRALLDEGVGKKLFRDLSSVIAKILVSERQEQRLMEELISLEEQIPNELKVSESKQVDPEVSSADFSSKYSSLVEASESLQGMSINEMSPSEDVEEKVNESVKEFDENGEMPAPPKIHETPMIQKRKSMEDMKILKIKSELESKKEYINLLTHEMGTVCVCLEMTHRASVPVLTAMFNQYGTTVLPLIAKVLTRATPRGHEVFKSDFVFVKLSDAEITAIESMIKVLSYFSQSKEARFPVVKQKGILSGLINVAEGKGIALDGDDKPCLFSDKCRLHLVGLLSNLTNSNEIPDIILKDENFMPAIIKVAKNDPLELVRQYAMVTINNLTSSELSSSMASIPGMLDLLGEAGLDGNKCTRTFAISSLNVLCNHDSNVAQILNYEKGNMVSLLATSMISKESVPDDVRTLVPSALLKLARNSGSSSAKSNFFPVFDILSTATLSDPNVSIRMKSAEILKEISKHVSSSPELLEALVVASNAADSGSMCCIAEALQYQSKVGNRKAMAENNGVINALINLASIDDNDYDASSSQTREAALGAINGLSSKAANRPLLAKNQKLIITLVKAVSRESESHQSQQLDSNSNLESLNQQESPTASKGSKWSRTKVTLLGLIEKI